MLARLGRLAEARDDLGAAEKYSSEANQIFEKLGERPNEELSKDELQRVKTKNPRIIEN